MQASSAILDSMIKFIQAHGDERVNEIKRQAANDFTVGKEKTIEAEKKRLSEQFAKDLASAEVNFKIEKSAQQNQQRIQRMRMINELVEGLQNDAKIKMHEKMTKDTAAYKNLLKQLLIQGLIRLIEADVTLRCRKSDVAHVEAIIDDAIKEYKKLMLS
jgi:V-type H+-transporting ATPase subunit E